MKKTSVISLSIISLVFLIATSYHTIVIDGVNDFSSDETFSTSSTGFITYVTWDANNIYLAYSGFDIGSGESDKKWIIFYFDTDAKLNPLSGNGTTDAIGFNTQDWVLPFNADYMIQIRTDEGANLMKRFNGSTWVDVASHNMQIFDNDGSNFIEIKIPRSTFNNPTKVYVLSYFVNEQAGSEWTYASFPDNSLRNGDGYKNPGYFDHWYGFELTNGVSPNASQNYDQREFLKWDMRLGASISSLSLSDTNNFAGTALNATDDYDANVDLEKPPAPPSNYVYLSFPHQDWSTTLGPHFYRDIRAYRNLDTSTVAWDFTINTDRVNANITISINEFSDVPSNYDIYINDLSNDSLHNVRTGGNYTYNSGSGGERNFQLVVGKYVPNIVVPSSIDFGNVKLEYDSTKTLQVRNDGLSSLTISGLSITGNFTLVGISTPILIDPGNSANVQIKFIPSSLGLSSGTLTITSDDPDSPNLNVSLSGNGIKPTVIKKFPPGWNLVGVPLYPSSPKKDSIFGLYTNNYVLFKYSNGNYLSVDSVFLGQAYWLGLNDTLNFSLTGMPVLQDTLISLNSGWNLISHLYLKDLLRTSLLVKKNSEIISIDSAVSRGWVQRNLFKFNKSTNSYLTTDTLDQFFGYWFAALTTGLELKFVKSQTFGTLPKIQNDFIDERNWKLNLIASNSISSDNLFYFGFNENATNNFDNKFDNAKPPLHPNDSAIEIYFKRPNWHPLFTKFYSDIRNYNINSTYIWDFEFYSRKTETSTLRWRNLQEIFPPDFLDRFTFILIDSTNNQTVNMKTTNQYQFNHNGNITKFAIRFGKLTDVSDDIANLDFSLSQNFPNPFNPSTKIRYSIKESVLVTIKLYDLIGREIAVLINENKNPGVYDIEIDANKLKLSSGIYIYKMTAGNFNSSKKLIYIK